MSEETDRPMKMVECPVCFQKYGQYLHTCPACGAPNETDEYKKYWSEPRENKS